MRRRLQTDGYVIVAEEERGTIDNEANVEYQNCQRESSTTTRPIA